MHTTVIFLIFFEDVTTTKDKSDRANDDSSLLYEIIGGNGRPHIGGSSL